MYHADFPFIYVLPANLSWYVMYVIHSYYTSIMYVIQVTVVQACFYVGSIMFLVIHCTVIYDNIDIDLFHHYVYYIYVI